MHSPTESSGLSLSGEGLTWARRNGGSAAGAGPAGRRRQATSCTSSHGPSFARMGSIVDRGTSGQGYRTNETGRWLVGRLGAGYTHAAVSQDAVAFAALRVRSWFSSDGLERSGLQRSIVDRRCWKRGAASRGGQYGRYRMLTDIFANRYSKVKLWDAVGEPERRLLVQVHRILEEQICPFWIDGKESARGKAFWTDIHSRLSMELGVKSLSPLAYSFQSTWAGKPHTNTGLWSINKVCETWMLQEFDNSTQADTFVKERLSLIEIGFRRREEEIAACNADLPTSIEAAQREVAQRQASRRSTLRVPGDRVSGLRVTNERLNAQFRNSVDELNARLRDAGCDLNYHNGLIQLSPAEASWREAACRFHDADGTQGLRRRRRQLDLPGEVARGSASRPLWRRHAIALGRMKRSGMRWRIAGGQAVMADQKWKNVDTDMKEALDRRDEREVERTVSEFC